jgi:hypothetical protein
LNLFATSRKYKTLSVVILGAIAEKRSEMSEKGWNLPSPQDSSKETISYSNARERSGTISDESTFETFPV